MKYTRLGASGLKISRIAPGCTGFGEPGTGMVWALDDAGAEPIFRNAFRPTHEGPGGSGPARKAILERVDASPRRLGAREPVVNAPIVGAARPPRRRGAPPGPLPAG